MFNRDLQAAGGAALRKPITIDVIQVADTVTTLDPVIEASEVQRMINSHNAQTKDKKMLELKRTVYFTGYLLNPTDTAKLLTLVKTPQNMHESDIKFLSNNILITFGPAPEHILTKVGGMGYKQTWQVTAFGTFENKVWAARVAPVPPISVYHTDNNVPFILLAHHRGARPNDANRIQNWQPVSADKQYVIQTTVGEKVQLRVEPETEGESEYDSLFDRNRRNHKRQHSPPSGPQQNHRPYGNDENRRPSGPSGSHRGGNQNRGRGGGGGRGGGNNNSRGGRGGGSGRGGGGNNRGRGGGGQRGYKSLDDVGSGGGRYNGQRGEPNYDDYVPNADGYNAAFPALGNGSGGLPYGK